MPFRRPFGWSLEWETKPTIAAGRSVTVFSSVNQDAAARHTRFLVDGFVPYLMDTAGGDQRVDFFLPLSGGEPLSITIDLGDVQRLSRIQLHAIVNGDNVPQAQPSDFGIPKRMLVESALTSDFLDAATLLDYERESILDAGPIITRSFRKTAMTNSRPTSTRLLADIDHQLDIEDHQLLATLPQRQQVGMALFYKECLTNIIRHSRASMVATQLVATPQALHLTVTDNGQGLAPGLEGRRGGHPVPGSLRRRARLLGARVAAADATDGGTQITLALPTFPWWKPSRVARLRQAQRRQRAGGREPGLRARNPARVGGLVNT